jgi:predicted GTPase
MLRMIEKFENKEINVIDEFEEFADKLPAIAVIGRPNTGKSTIVNRL